MIIFIALLLFHTILLDIVRYRMAYAETEDAARSAGRSVMSRFHTGLLKYGLFGFDANTSEFETTLAFIYNAGVSPQQQNQTSIFETFIDKDQIGVEPLYHLGDHTVFRRQVLEKMKYLAGIEFAREITQKVSRGRQQIAQAEQFAQLSQKMEALIRKRDEELDKAWDTAKTLVQTCISEAGDEEISESETANVQRIIYTLSGHLKKAEEANDQLRIELNSSLSKTNRAPAEDAVVPHVSVLPPDYFSLYRVKAGSVVSLFGSVANAVRNIDPEAAESARTRLADFANDWLALKAKEEERRLREMSQLRKLQADEKNKMDREVKKIGELWKDGCMPSGTTAGYVNMINAYKKLEGENGFYQKYQAYNMHNTSGGMSEMDANDGQTFGLQSLAMLNTISELAEDARDEVLVNEFALTFFTHRTWDKMKYPVRFSPNIGDRGGHLLKNQEAEYILYGFPECTLNLSAAHTEVFGLRMALRTVEALADPKRAASGSPLLVLLTAMAEGAKRAHTDTVNLLSGEDVELPFLPAAVMNYKDHLRLFYLLHSRDASVLSRMQALIELNTTADLMKQYSAVRVKARAEPRLWLLKGIGAIEREAVVSY